MLHLPVRRGADAATVAAPEQSLPEASPIVIGHAEQVGLETEQRVHDRCAPVDAEFGERLAGRRLHGVDDVACLECHGFHYGPGQLSPPDPAGQPHQGAAGVRVPIRAAQAGECRYQVGTAGVVDRGG